MLMQRPLQLGRESVGKNLHIAREHDDIGPRVAHDLPDLRLLLHLCGLGDRQIVKRDLVEVDVVVGLAGIIGDDRDDVHRQFAAAPAIEEVDEAMVEARDQ